MKNGKRILSVTIKRMVDPPPDTSCLGEYGNNRKSEYSIDRAHSLDCPANSHANDVAIDQLEHVIRYLQTVRQNIGNNSEDPTYWTIDESIDLVAELQNSLAECTCDEHGDMTRNEYRYFNGPIENYKGESPEDIRKYVLQDYARSEALNRGDWRYLGIRVEADIQTSSESPIQTVTSGGLWGIESDSEAKYIADVEAEELASLRRQLYELGFSKRAIAAACKHVERKDS